MNKPAKREVSEATAAPIDPPLDAADAGMISAVLAGEADIEEAVAELADVEDEQEFEARWNALEALHPGNIGLWAARAMRLIRQKDFEAAIAFIGDRAFADDDGAGLATKAALLYDAHARDEAVALFDTLLERFPERRDVRTNYAKRLFAEGHLALAHALLVPVHDSFSEGTKSLTLWERSTELLSLLTRLEGAPLTVEQDARILAMKHAILHFRNREVRVQDTAGLGRLTLSTGSLGPGGAERQLTRLAVELEKARKASGQIAGIPLQRPVEVLVRSHGPEKQNDFYLGDLRAGGVELHQFNEFEPVSPKNLGVTNHELLTLLDYLPSSVNYGVKRLTRHFLESGTDTASAWQDGACLFTGLAALIAEVPQIQLAIRGLPPSVRRHMYRPEYEELYRAMAQVPGVTFISNNESAARAYADWLDIPLHRFEIVYNGVEPMHTNPSPTCDAMWSEFAARTTDAVHTIGGVFRFDTDKQPLLWIRFAARYLKRHPNSRMVAVGGGRLLEHAQRLAEELSISDRILFTGRSTNVGYWMAKMNVLVLTSRYEGLPNVLIEAQYMGVRVVTTPAGGAPECLINGVTGHVLDCAEKPDLENMVKLVDDLAHRSHDRTLFAQGGVAREFLDSRFSIPHMLAQYVACTCSASAEPKYGEGMGTRPRQAA